MIPNPVKDILKKQHYSLVGKHSAVQICGWTKKSLLDNNFCYKQKFYGIESHRCCQMSAWLSCQNKCLHCWRAVELDFEKYLENECNTPKEIIEGCVKSQRKLLTGFKANEKINLKKFYEAHEPMHFAISLIGEATFYPELAEFIQELRKQGKTSFLVTNGLLPEKLIELQKKNALPTQLYLSLLYPDEELFRKITQNKIKNSWKKFNETIDLFSKLKTRRVVRLTVARNLNMEDKMLKSYTKILKRASSDFIEVKGYMAVGFSKKRLGHTRMPIHAEVKDYAEKLLKFLPEYNFLDEKAESKVVLLGKDKEKMKIKQEEI